jgi:hypothetical protein
MLLALILLPLISAFGVSNFYYGNNPLRMDAGETKEITFLLQNIVGNQDFTARAEISEGQEIARINDSGVYQVPLGTQDVPVKVVVSIPKKDKAGKKYTIKLGITAIPKNEEGTISLSQGTGAIVPVEITGKESKYFYIIISLAVLAIIIVIIILYIKHRKSLKTGGFYNY